MIDIPVLLLYAGTIMQVHGGAAVWAQTKQVVPGLLVGLMWAVVLAAVGLALASVSGRRAFSTGAVAIFMFMTWTLTTVLTHIARMTGPHGSGAHLSSAAGVTTAAHLFGLISPFTVVDGVRQWLGGTSPGIVAAPGTYGPAYGVMLLLFLAVLPQFTNPSRGWPLAAQLATLGLVFTLTCGAFYLCLGSAAERILRTRPGAARVLTRVSGAAMAVIGALLLAERLLA